MIKRLLLACEKKHNTKIKRDNCKKISKRVTILNSKYKDSEFKICLYVWLFEDHAKTIGWIRKVLKRNELETIGILNRYWGHKNTYYLWNVASVSLSQKSLVLYKETVYLSVNTYNTCLFICKYLHNRLLFDEQWWLLT